MGSKEGENPAALCEAVFSLASKNLRGDVQTPPPPLPAGRGLPRKHDYLFLECRARESHEDQRLRVSAFIGYVQ